MLLTGYLQLLIYISCDVDRTNNYESSTMYIFVNNKATMSRIADQRYIWVIQYGKIIKQYDVLIWP